MALTEKQKWILGGTLVIGGLAIYIQSSKTPFIKPNKIIWPPSNPPASAKNQVYLAIREKSELQPLLLNHTPLLLNFVYRGDTASNKITGKLQRLLIYDTDKLINMVDIESDSGENRELLQDYQVTTIPTLVALKDQLPRGSYIDTNLLKDPENNEVNYADLKEFVESHGIDGPKSKSN